MTPYRTQLIGPDRIKVFRQRAVMVIGGDYAHAKTQYGGWRMWCGKCNAYEWAGGHGLSEAVDYAREHCRKAGRP